MENSLSAAAFRSRKKETHLPKKNPLPPVGRKIGIYKKNGYGGKYEKIGNFILIQEFPFGFLGINPNGKTNFFTKKDFISGILMFSLTNPKDGL